MVTIMRKALLLSVLVIAATAAAPASSEPEAVGGSGSLAAVSGSDRASGPLSLNAALLLRSTSVPGCPLGPTADQCVTRTTSGAIPGLGQVEATYSHFLGLGAPACAPGFGKTLAYPIRLTVALKGELELAVAEGTCQAAVSVPNQARTFTITGGVGIYAGASGSGTLQPQLAQEVCDASSCHRDGYENWTGTLTVPGVEFDVTAPKLAGASSKTVRVPKKARNARVTFNVTATDDVDGAVPTTCQPKSGSRFKVGKTRVQCQAADTSANTAKASFVVTVKRR